MHDLRIGDNLTIPATELVESFTTSGGPGGQHANRSSTRVTLAWDIAVSSVVDVAMERRLRQGAGEHLVGDEIRVTVGDSRSQWRNRQLARKRLVTLLTAALRPPAPVRRRTRPSHRARERRLREKRSRGETKQLRKRPDGDD